MSGTVTSVPASAGVQQDEANSGPENVFHAGERHGRPPVQTCDSGGEGDCQQPRRPGEEVSGMIGEGQWDGACGRVPGSAMGGWPMVKL